MFDFGGVWLASKIVLWGCTRSIVEQEESERMDALVHLHITLSIANSKHSERNTSFRSDFAYATLVGNTFLQKLFVCRCIFEVLHKQHAQNRPTATLGSFTAIWFRVHGK